MKNFNLIKQSSGITAATIFLLIIVLSIRFFALNIPAAADISAADMPLGMLLDSVSLPNGAMFALAILFALTNATLLDSIIVRHSLCPHRTFLPMALYFIAAYAIAFPAHPLSFSVFQLALILTTMHAINAFRRSYQFQNIFLSAFFLGLIPLLFSQAAILVILLPVSLFLYHRTLREAVAALAGLLIPWLLCSTAWWMAGCDWGYCFASLGLQLSNTTSSSILDFISTQPLLIKVFAGLYTVTGIASVIIILRNFNPSKSRTQKIHTHFLWMALLGVAPMFIAGGTTVGYGTLAVAGTVIITSFFTRYKSWLPLLAYVSMVVLAVMSNLPAFA